MKLVSHAISVVIPCFNEHESLEPLLRKIRERVPGAEIVVVDDGSLPPVPAYEAVQVIRHPINMGNGAAIKTGARQVTGDIIVFMDGDGQHDPADIPRLLEKLGEGFGMAVGARVAISHASIGRRLANSLFNRLASWMTGHRILDLTSGFRAVRARPFRNILYLLPNGFSYPATSTMAFFRSGQPVAYVPITARTRTGESKIKPLRDGLRFLVVIIRIGALFSPMRFFLPIAGVVFVSATLFHGYTYFTTGRFTNMGAVLYIVSFFTLMFGIISEQISALHYRYSEQCDTQPGDER